MKLTNDTLTRLPASLAAPDYDRATVTAGIVHVGLGNFHRAHQAVYLDDLLAQGATDWGILGAGVMPGDADMRTGLLSQDCLYSVSEQDSGHDSARVVGSMTGFVPVAAGHGPLVTALSDPQIRIASLTVTEGGYFVNSDGSFNAAHPAILTDVARPDAPETVFGALVAGLRARRAAGVIPFTVMSCDNLPHNGAVTRRAVLGVAHGQDPALAAWIDAHVTFPNGMVDRITPASTAARQARFQARHGVEDIRPVFCEPFRQWVLEDKFCNGRPALEQVGVQFVNDVSPFELMKIRILNGGHATLAYAAGMLDIEYVHEAMQNRLVAGFLGRVERHEIVPVVPPVPGTSLDDYLDLIERRFANPQIGDTIRRLCFDGLNRQPKFIVPSALDGLAAGRKVDGLALASALWCRYCAGTTDSGAVIAPNDPDWDALNVRAKAARGNPALWLEMTAVYGTLGQNPVFAEAFAQALSDLWANGAAATLEAYVTGA